MNILSAKDAVKLVKTGQKIWLHNMGCNPTTLTKALKERVLETDDPRDLTFFHSHIDGPAYHSDPEVLEKGWWTDNLFIGSNLRKSYREGRSSYIPTCLSDYPKFLKENPCDVALLHCTPPDEHGYCSLGVDCTGTFHAVKYAKTVISQINPQMPRTFGNNQIHISQIDAFVEVDQPIYEINVPPPTEKQMNIAKHIIHLIEDGSTLQLGIGGVPDAILHSLMDHKHLGIHTEMLTSTVVDLIKAGVIDNSKKNVYPGFTVCTFVDGKKDLYDYVDNNPKVLMYPCDFVNNPYVIAQNPKVVAINGAIGVDFTGQVCADSLGAQMFSGVGGQADFMSGAKICPDGKSITVLPATAKGDTVSRISPVLPAGSGIVTPRHTAGYIATEFGCAKVWGKNLIERAKALIGISHPKFREQLCEDASKMLKTYISPNDIKN